MHLFMESLGIPAIQSFHPERKCPRKGTATGIVHGYFLGISSIPFAEEPCTEIDLSFSGRGYGLPNGLCNRLQSNAVSFRNFFSNTVLEKRREP